jgi:phosphoglycolate phosphatase
MNNPPRLLILDFDGTLADSWPWLIGMLAETTARFGLARLDPAEAEAMRGLDHRAVIARLGVPAWKLPAIAAHLRRAALAAPPPPLFPGIAAMLGRLHAAGITLGIASSNTEAQIRRSLGDDLAGLVGHVAAEASLLGKPARFRRILRASGIAAGAAMAVGDEPRDIEAARAAGIRAGAVAWGYARPDLLGERGPDALFANPEALADWCGA